MYTVKELIETLKQCPEDYEVLLCDDLGTYLKIEQVGIDHAEQDVTLFSI